jgi:predicted anti-sigma-YlaC factor YlaD
MARIPALSDTEASEIEDHLASCPGCRNLQLELTGDQDRRARASAPDSATRTYGPESSMRSRLEQALARPAVEESGSRGCLWSRLTSSG